MLNSSSSSSANPVGKGCGPKKRERGANCASLVSTKEQLRDAFYSKDYESPGNAFPLGLSAVVRFAYSTPKRTHLWRNGTYLNYKLLLSQAYMGG